MVIGWIFLGVAALLVACLLLRTFLWSCALTDKEETLERWEISLEEREQWNKEDFLANADSDGWKEFHAEYAVSESDELKYTTEEAIYRHAKKCLTLTIANDIKHTFEPKEEILSNGNRMFYYDFKVNQ